MAITALSTLKSWFQPHLKPLATQFSAWMDSFWHKSEAIPTTAIDGLSYTLNTLATTTQLNTVAANLAALAAVVNGLGGGTYAPNIDVDLSTGQGYQIAAESFVNFIKITAPVNTILSLGSTVGGNDILDSQPITSTPFFLTTPINGGTTIYATFGGTTVHLSIKK